MVGSAASARPVGPAPVRPPWVRTHDRASGVPGSPPTVAGPASPEKSQVSAVGPGAVGGGVSSRHGAGGDRVSPGGTAAPGRVGTDAVPWFGSPWGSPHGIGKRRGDCRGTGTPMSRAGVVDRPDGYGVGESEQVSR